MKGDYIINIVDGQLRQKQKNKIKKMCQYYLEMSPKNKIKKMLTTK
jgi:hypothetical protein